MPTSYTAAIKDGISFSEFALRCSRAFGALMMMRDEPLGAAIPERFDPSSYHAEKLAEARAELGRLRSMSMSAATAAADAEFQQQMAAHFERENERDNLRDKYQEMLNEAKAWAPPSEEHAGLKEFMIQQIEESIRFDCSTTHITAPEPMSGAGWLIAKIAKAKHDIEYHTKEHALEVERTEGRNLWIKQLRESLESCAA